MSKIDAKNKEITTKLTTLEQEFIIREQEFTAKKQQLIIEEQEIYKKKLEINNINNEIIELTLKKNIIKQNDKLPHVIKDKNKYKDFMMECIRCMSGLGIHPGTPAYKVYIEIIENILNDESEYIISNNNNKYLITNKCKIFLLKQIFNDHATNNNPIIGYYVDLNIDVTYPILKLVIHNINTLQPSDELSIFNKIVKRDLTKTI